MGYFKTELSPVKKRMFAEGVVPPKLVFKRKGNVYVKGYEASPAGVAWNATRYCWDAKVGDLKGLKHFRTKEEAIAYRNKLMADNFGTDQVCG